MPENTVATQFTETVLQHLPDDLSNKFREILQSSGTESTLEDVFRFVHGAESDTAGRAWEDRSKQEGARKALDALLKPSDLKRRRDAEDVSTSAKRPKFGGDIEDSGAPLYTLHSISATSPVRKKVDLVVTASSLKFLNSTSQATEAVVSLGDLKRAFILPTRGKTKPHWTVVILSTDKQDKASPSPQVIFGLDASVTAPLSVTVAGAEKTLIKKGDSTLPFIRTFLSHLLLPNAVYETDTSVFKSACSKEPVAGTEAYLGAKIGSLWFLKDGILWGESKPCEFWPSDALMDIRIISATGRQCSATLIKRMDGNSDYEEGEGEETAFTFIDGREQDGMAQWLRKYRKVPNGVAPVAPVAVPSGPLTINSLALESDSEDEDFEDKSDSDSEEGNNLSDEEKGSADDASGDDDEDEAAEEEGPEEGEEEEEEEEELKPENHPLMRPGAMPKMSKAAMNMVVDMMEDELMGGDEIDELED